LAFGVGASIISSVATGRLMACVRVGTLVPVGTLVVAAALGEEAVAPSLWVFAIGTVLFGLGFGALDSAINAHAASHFGARDINWVHASYGLGATVGPLATTAVLGAGLSWLLYRCRPAELGYLADALGAVANGPGKAISRPPRVIKLREAPGDIYLQPPNF
jgi:MFS family permease